MKKRIINGTIVAFFAVSMLVAASNNITPVAAASNLIVNGSFESGPALVSITDGGGGCLAELTGTMATVNPPSTAITGWTAIDDCGNESTCVQVITVLAVPAACSIGDTVFYDNNGDGIQDLLAEGGISGITLNLYLDDGNGVFDPPDDVLVGSAFTNGDGYYVFTGLDCTATYWVDVVDSPLLSGLTLTTGSDPWGPIRFPPEAEAQAQGCTDADFGYRPAQLPPRGVGGEAYPVNKLAILMPWIALFAGIPCCAVILTRRRVQS